MTVAAAAALSNKRKFLLAATATSGCLAGCLLGVAVLPLGSDGIANSYLSIEVMVATLATAIISAIFILPLRDATVTNERVRRALWLALIISVCFSPVALALTPVMTSSRILRNERVAGDRVKALKTAVQRSMAENGDPRSYCGGKVLKLHYSGPSFSDNDWDLITRNYVTREGYAFMVFCPEKGGYRISALPHISEQDGNRIFCSDDSGQSGCKPNGSW